MRKRAVLATRLDQGLDELAYALLSAGYELVVGDHSGPSIVAAGLPVVPVEFATQQSKLLGGRAATLHHSLHVGIAADLNDENERAALARANIPQIDVVVAQLPQSAEELGGLESVGSADHAAVAALIHSAVARWDRVAVLTSPSDFLQVPQCLEPGEEGQRLRRRLAHQAMLHLQRFIALQVQIYGGAKPEKSEQAETDEDEEVDAVDLSLPAGGWAVVLAPAVAPAGPSTWRVYDDNAGSLAAAGSFDLLHGPAPDLHSLLNLDVSVGMLQDMPSHPSCVVSVRGHICSVASSPDSSMRALLRAIGADPVAARGGVLVFNGRIDTTLARALADFEHAQGLRLIAAEAFDDEAAVMLGQDAERTLLEVPRSRRGGVRAYVRPTRYGVFIEGSAQPMPDLGTARLMTETEPDEKLFDAAELAFRVARHCASCCVVIADQYGTLGISSGQAHATDAVQIAAAKARRANRPCAAALTHALESPAVVAVMARAQVRLILASRESVTEALLEAADAAEIAVLEVTEGWRTLR